MTMRTRRGTVVFDRERTMRFTPEGEGRFFERRLAKYPLDRHVRDMAKHIEEYKGIVITLVAFHDDSRLAEGRENRPIGAVLDRASRTVYIYWNLDRADARDVEQRLFSVRRNIDATPTWFRKKQSGDDPVFRPGPTWEDDDDDVESAEWWMKQKVTRQKLEQLHTNPAYRKHVAYTISFPEIFLLSNTSVTFNMYLGNQNDFWFYVLMRLLIIDGRVVHATLGSLWRKPLNENLRSVREVGYQENVDYRAWFYDAYRSVYLTEDSSAQEVLMAAIDAFMRSGAVNPNNPQQRRRDVYGRRDAKGAYVMSIAKVIARHRDYLDTLYDDDGANTAMRWGYVIDADTGAGKILVDDDFHLQVGSLAGDLVRRGFLNHESWLSQDMYTTVNRWTVNHRMGALNVLKRFPPLSKKMKKKK